MSVVDIVIISLVLVIIICMVLLAICCSKAAEWQNNAMWSFPYRVLKEKDKPQKTKKA